MPSLPRDAVGNVVRPLGFMQVAIWRGTPHEERQIPLIEGFLRKVTNSRVMYLETLVTEAGRHDVLVAVHREDLPKFAVQRFKMGDDRPIWIEDSPDMGVYESRIAHYRQFGVKHAPEAAAEGEKVPFLDSVR